MSTETVVNLATAIIQAIKSTPDDELCDDERVQRVAEMIAAGSQHPGFNEALYEKALAAGIQLKPTDRATVLQCAGSA